MSGIGVMSAPREKGCCPGYLPRRADDVLMDSPPIDHERRSISMLALEALEPLATPYRAPVALFYLSEHTSRRSPISRRSGRHRSVAYRPWQGTASADAHSEHGVQGAPRGPSQPSRDARTCPAARRSGSSMPSLNQP